MCLCVQLHRDWQLAADMPLTEAGWGIIYPLCVHDEHPDLADYDRQVGLADIVTGESSEPVDPAAQQRRRTQLTKVKRKRASDADSDEGGPEPNKGIRQHTKGMQGNETDAHKAKKKRKADCGWPAAEPVQCAVTSASIHKHAIELVLSGYNRMFLPSVAIPARQLPPGEIVRL